MRAIGRLPAVIAAATLALVAGRAEAAEVEAQATKEAPKAPWRGTAISYDHTLSTVGLSKAALPTWDPYYAHTLALRPEWHFGDQFFVRGSWSVEQELTTANDYESSHPAVASDLALDFNHTGWKEPRTGINVSGGLRVVLPVSEKSSFEQLYFTLAPGATLTRKFDVLQGLVVGYSGRVGYNFREYATSQYDGLRVMCEPGEDCDQYEKEGGKDTGRATAEYTIGHGPMVSLVATDKLSFTTFYTLSAARMYDLGSVDSDEIGVRVDTNGDGRTEIVGEADGTRWRYLEWFGLEAAYQLTDAVGLAAAVNTAAPQQRPNSEDYQRFFNRFTTFSVSANVDVDALSKLF